MCFELPVKLEIQSLQIQTLPCWPDFLVRTLHTVATWLWYYFLWINTRLVTCCFTGILLKIFNEPSFLEINILWCTPLWDAFHNICKIWEYCEFSHEWDCEKFIIKHHIKLMWYITNSWVYDHRYWSCTKWWVTKIFPTHKYCSKLGSTTILPCNIASQI